MGIIEVATMNHIMMKVTVMKKFITIMRHLHLHHPPAGEADNHSWWVLSQYFVFIYHYTGSQCARSKWIHPVSLRDCFFNWRFWRIYIPWKESASHPL